MQVQPFWLGNKGCSPRPACLCPPHCRSAASWCRHAGAHSTFFYNCLLYCSPNLLVSALCIISQLQAVVVMLVRILLSFTTASSNVLPTFLFLPSVLSVSCKLLSSCWCAFYFLLQLPLLMFPQPSCLCPLRWQSAASCCRYAGHIHTQFLLQCLCLLTLHFKLSLCLSERHTTKAWPLKLAAWSGML